MFNLNLTWIVINLYSVFTAVILALPNNRKCLHKQVANFPKEWNFIVWEHQYGRGDVMRKSFTDSIVSTFGKKCLICLVYEAGRDFRDKKIYRRFKLFVSRCTKMGKYQIDDSWFCHHCIAFLEVYFKSF